MHLLSLNTNTTTMHCYQIIAAHLKNDLCYCRSAESPINHPEPFVFIEAWISMACATSTGMNSCKTIMWIRLALFFMSMQR